MTHATPAYLETLKAKLDARTQPGGTDKAIPGYKRNVLALRAEIARVENELAARTTTSTDPVTPTEPDPPLAA